MNQSMNKPAGFHVFSDVNFYFYPWISVVQDFDAALEGCSLYSIIHCPYDDITYLGYMTMKELESELERLQK